MTQQKNILFLKKFGRDIVLSIINRNMKKYRHMSTLSYADDINDINDVTFLTSWKYYFFYRINNYCYKLLQR